MTDLLIRIFLGWLFMCGFSVGVFVLIVLVGQWIEDRIERRIR